MPLHRRVFFIGGFDPRSPRHTWRLFRQAAQAHPASALGEEVVLTAPEASGSRAEAGWQVSGEILARSQFQIWAWDDIVRQHWRRTPWRILRDLWVVYVRAASEGLLSQVRRQAPAAFWLSMVPCLMVVGVVLMTLLAGMALAALQIHFSGLSGPFGASLPWLLALTMGALAWWRLSVRLDVTWLLRLFGFTWTQSNQQVDHMDARLSDWAASVISAASDEHCDEVLIVAHSTGGMWAVTVLAQALRQAPWLGQRGPQLGLLTLGHCMPILSGLPSAQAFRTDLQLLQTHGPLTWLDVSAPADWAAFARVPPWLGDGQARLRQCSPRFHQTLSIPHYQALLADRHALHMQYLRAPDVAGGYDPVSWIFGPDTLQKRYADMASTTPPA